MSWFDKHKWSRRRAEEERQALAASVEELTTREKVQIEEWGEDDEGGDEPASGPAVIPPRLRLQSRALPAMRPTARSERGQEVAEPGKRLGRSTKIHLQAVQPGQEPITERVQVLERIEQWDIVSGEKSESEGQVLARRLEPLASPVAAPSALLCGSGVIEAGQEDATIANARISAQSVVSVMLAGNPGPVVVHYVSLQPRAGFTLHMSAPVSADTPFTYAVWLF